MRWTAEQRPAFASGEVIPIGSREARASRSHPNVISVYTAARIIPPAWSLNLHAHPDATVEAGARTLSVTASEITGEEYETAWDRYVATNPGSPGTARNYPAPADLHPGRPSQVVTAQPSATTT